MKIEVTAADIYYGIKQSCFNCPVARAISKAFNGSVVAVRTIGIYIDGKKFPLPEPVKKFMADYDDGNVVQPFSFSLEYEIMGQVI